MKKLFLIISLFCGFVGVQAADLNSIMLLIDYEEKPGMPMQMKQSFRSSLAQNDAALFVTRHIVEGVFTGKKEFTKLSQEKEFQPFLKESSFWELEILNEIVLLTEEARKVGNDLFGYKVKKLKKEEIDEDAFENLEKRQKEIPAELEQKRIKREKLSVLEKKVQERNMGNSNRGFYKNFDFDFSRWRVFEVDGDYLFIPVKQETLIRLAQSQFKSIENEDHLFASFEGAQDFSVVETIKKALRALSNDATVWNIYLMGHGVSPEAPRSPYNWLKSLVDLSSSKDKDGAIAGLNYSQIKDLLHSLAHDVKVKLLYYRTCYGGGSNANQIARYLKQIYSEKKTVKGFFAGSKSTTFPIVTATILDVSVKDRHLAQQLSDYFTAVRGADVSTREGIAKVIAILHPPVDQCPRNYTSMTIESFFPGVLFPGSSNFIPITTCPSLLIVTSKTQALTIDETIKGVLFTIPKITKPVVFKSEKIPPIFMASSGNTEIVFDYVSVPKSTGVSFTSFIQKAFFDISVYYKKIYHLKKLKCWVSVDDKNYKALEPFLDSEGEVELSGVFLQREVSGNYESIGFQFITPDGKKFFINGVGKEEKAFSELSPASPI